MAESPVPIPLCVSLAFSSANGLFLFLFDNFCSIIAPSRLLVKVYPEILRGFYFSKSGEQMKKQLEVRQNRPILSPFGSSHALPAQRNTTVGIILVTITEIRFSLWNVVRYEIFTNLIDKGVNSGYNT